MKTPSEAYIEKEEAAQRKPAELYHIWRDGGVHWRYTDGDVSIVYDGNTYTPATLSRSLVRYSEKMEVTTMTVSAQYAEEPIIEFLANNPIEVLWIEVSKVFRDQDPLEVGIIFVGQIKNVSFQGVEATAHCVGFEYFLRMPVPVFRYQINCNHNLFDAKCKIAKAGYKTITNVTVDFAGTSLTSGDFGSEDDGYFTFGRIEFGDTYRTIVNHVGNVVTLAYAFKALETGNSVDAYPGCDGFIETCRDKYSNVIQFLGFPYIPIENPATRIS